jgi:hypothetical protein
MTREIVRQEEQKGPAWWPPLLLLLFPALVVAGFLSMCGVGRAARADGESSSRAAPSVAALEGTSALASAYAEPPPASFGSQDGAPSLAQLEALVETDAARALDAVRADKARFPTSELDERRDFLEIKALTRLDQIGKARDLATAFYAAHPSSALVEDVHALTGQHLPPRMGPDVR